MLAVFSHDGQPESAADPLARSPSGVRHGNRSHSWENERSGRLYEESSRSSAIDNPFMDNPQMIKVNVLRLFMGPARIVMDDWTPDYKADPETFSFFVLL